MQRVKWALWILAAAPLIDLAILLLAGGLGPNPQETLLRATGMWCLVLLLVTLGVTPARRLLDWPQLVGVRRMLGLWVFAYACIHLLSFWAFEHDFSTGALLADSLVRPFVAVGLIAFVLLVPMAITSNRLAMVRLGPAWKKIHWAIYVVALLACLHFFLHRAGKNNLADPFWAAGVTIMLLVARLKR